jgi:hypothetical protein
MATSFWKIVKTTENLAENPSQQQWNLSKSGEIF